MNLIHEIKVYLSVVTIPTFVRLWVAMRGPMQSSFIIHVSVRNLSGGKLQSRAREATCNSLFPST